VIPDDTPFSEIHADRRDFIADVTFSLYDTIHPDIAADGDVLCSSRDERGEGQAERRGENLKPAPPTLLIISTVRTYSRSFSISNPL
jgi:hypothetical protein